MPKKTLLIIILALVTLVIWIYRSSIVEFHDTVLSIQQSQALLDPLIYPRVAICHESPFIIIIVTSFVGHVELRSAHRRAMPSEDLLKLNITRVFLLARIPTNYRYITQESIEDENLIYGDILQGNFYENYRNLTYKHLMGLQWASTSCSNASFILKVDDDTVFNLDATYRFLLKVPDKEKPNFIMGYMLNNTKPRRNEQNKWFVSWEEYPVETYPPYLSGWYYIISPMVATLISNEAKYYPYFWIDDIFVTGILTNALGLKLKSLPQNYWLEYYELLECCLRDMIAKFIKCDYVVGPNGGRNDLIVEFNKAISQCNQWNNCTIRASMRDLKTHCVMFKDREIFSSGKGEIKHITL